MQEEKLELEISKPLIRDPSSHIYMGKDILDFLNLMEGHIIKYETIIRSGVIPPDVLNVDMEKIEESTVVVGAHDYLVHVKALGTK